MSTFTQDPLRHDLFVGLACRRLLNSLKGSKIISVEGAMPFEDCIAPCTKSLFGYRPDAVIDHRGSYWIVEVKSMVDISSRHTAEQFRIIGNVLKSDERFNLYVVVFDCEDEFIVQRMIRRYFHNERTVFEAIINDKELSGETVQPCS